MNVSALFLLFTSLLRGMAMGIECPSMDTSCEPGKNSNCCVDGGDKQSLWPGQKLMVGEWLCKEDYAFGILHSGGSRGTLHVLKKTSTETCDPIWTAMHNAGNSESPNPDEYAEGVELEMADDGTHDGNAIIFGRGGGKKWVAGCFVDGSRLKMSNVNPSKSNPKIVKILKSKRNWRAQWWVDSEGEEEHDCERF
eukprot:CAMPEP_0113530992 /NCGR_PEP_ID=MMETSP0015_2-20120614/3250_1 /TAXON_ID=2838 /ORGANISM="Odontella" /LENGTH=194 /DNA_ID=CAMNT_0000429781 /DNA_START=139 /DNA_END=723 /DNA_ORIENTATION=+ /assembly_acc=CAM_ASM_000160